MAHDTTVLSRESFSCQAACFFTSFLDANNLPPPHGLFPLPPPHAVGAKLVPSSPDPCQWLSPGCSACVRPSVCSTGARHLVLDYRALYTWSDDFFQKVLSSAIAWQCQIILCFLRKRSYTRVLLIPRHFPTVRVVQGVRALAWTSLELVIQHCWLCAHFPAYQSALQLFPAIKDL